MQQLSERRLIFLVGSIQFVNILGFMMVIPLGPDFALALGFATSDIGLVAGAYSLTSAGASLIASRFLDRFERRRALTFALLGLGCGTAAASLAWDLPSLVSARIAAGLFSASAYSLAMTILIDRIPDERRGRAMGAVMGAFSVASVLGIPAGLVLSRLGGWQTPFLAVGVLGLLAAGFARLSLPRLAGQGVDKPPFNFLLLFKRPEAVLAFFVAGVAVFGNFLLIPSLSAYVQFNLDYPRDSLGLLYLIGGAISFFSMRFIGRWNDRFGSFSAVIFAVGLLAVVLASGFLTPVLLIPVIVLFPLFMISNSARHVTVTTLVSKVPRAHERAGFMAVVTALQHLAAALGALTSTVILSANADGTLVGIPFAASLTMAMAALLLPGIYILETRIRRRKKVLTADEAIKLEAQAGEIAE